MPVAPVARKIKAILGPAPVGHRQPTRAEVGDDEGADEDRVTKEIDEENRILDQELKGICRGC